MWTKKLEMHKKYDDIVCAPNYVQFAPIPTPPLDEVTEEEKSNWIQIILLMMAIFVGILLKISLF